MSDNVSGAIENYREVLKLDPDNPIAQNNLAWLLVDNDLNLEEALSLAKEVKRKYPENPEIADTLGWAFYKLGRYEEAVVQLERAVKLRPNDPIINDHLGDAYWRVGRKLEARFQWSHARDMKPTAENLETIKKKLAEGLEVDKTDAASNEKPGEDSGG